MKRILRVVPLAALCGVIIFLTGWQQAPAASSTVEVGIAPVGQKAIEFVGKLDQDGVNFTAYGYVSYLYGVPTSALFTDPVLTNEHTARVTFYIASTLTNHFVISDTAGSLFVINSTGTATYYFNATPNADFGNPSSFASGVPVASGSLRFHDILNIQAPNRGIPIGTGEFTQLSATPLDIGGQLFQLGRVGLTERLSYTGAALRTDPVPPISHSVFAGDATVIAVPGQ